MQTVQKQDKITDLFHVCKYLLTYVFLDYLEGRTKVDKILG